MNDKHLLTVAETADYLAVKIAWVYAHSRELPAIKLGAGLRFRVADLDVYITSQTVGARP